jgi:hypothetical protein
MIRDEPSHRSGLYLIGENDTDERLDLRRKRETVED